MFQCSVRTWYDETLKQSALLININSPNVDLGCVVYPNATELREFVAALTNRGRCVLFPPSDCEECHRELRLDEYWLTWQNNIGKGRWEGEGHWRISVDDIRSPLLEALKRF